MEATGSLYLCMVMDKIPGQSLFDWIIQHQQMPLPRIMQNIRKTMNTMHTLQMLHNDLHMQNMLVSEDRVWFIDFSEAKLFSQSLTANQRELEWKVAMVACAYLYGSEVLKIPPSKEMQGGMIQSEQIQEYIRPGFAKEMLPFFVFHFKSHPLWIAQFFPNGIRKKDQTTKRMREELIVESQSKKSKYMDEKWKEMERQQRLSQALKKLTDLSYNRPNPAE
jgi:hypothetical protein